MAEGVGGAVPGWRLQHRHLGADLAEQRHDVGHGRVVLGVQQHVEQRKLDLSQGLHAALEVLGGQHLVEQRTRQRLAGVHMGRHVLEHVPFPAEILHELAGQLHRIPFDAANAGDITLVHLRQHVVQSMAELMEQGGHVVMREQCRAAVHGIGKIAHQVRHRRLQAAGVRAQPAGAHIVHPGAAALARARRRIQVELANQLRPGRVTGGLGALDPVESHTRMPQRRFVLADRHFKQGLHDLEQTSQHLGRGEILLDLLLIEGVAGFLELFADVSHIPGLQRLVHAHVAGSEGLQVGQVALREGTRLGGELAQKSDDLLRRLGHLGGDRHLAEIAVAQQLRLLAAQLEDLTDQRAVVKTLCQRVGLVRGAGGEGAVELFPQGAAVRKLHDRQVARHLQAELVAVTALGAGGVQRGVLDIVRHAGEFFGGGVVGEGIGGVERVFAEFLAERSLPLLDLGKAQPGGAGELGPAQHKVAYGVLVGLGLFGVQADRVDGLVFGIQAFISAQASPELGHPGQGLVVGGPQGRRVGHAVEVADGAPGAAQSLGGDIQHSGDRAPAGRKVAGGDGLQCGVDLGQQRIDSGADVLGLDLVKQRQVVKVEQRVGHGGQMMVACAQTSGRCDVGAL